MEDATKTVKVLYYDSETSLEDVFKIYQELKPILPDLIILPDSTRLKTESLHELKKIRDNLNVTIDFLED